jgi:hypothetical protein
MPQFTLLDDYSRRARFLPAMIAMLPAIFAAAVWLPALKVAPIITVFFSWFGLGVLLSELSRDAGKRREAKLWASWDGSPTVRRLRLRAESDNPTARDHWRARLAVVAPDTPLLNQHDEVADPMRADRAIEVCVARLRELTRDTTRFPLVFQENVSYGFRRNLWAMKPAAIFLIVLALALAMLAVVLRHPVELYLIVVSVACSAVMLTWWLLRIRSAWVREAAERYADQLLWSCELLEIPQVQPPADLPRVGF